MGIDKRLSDDYPSVIINRVKYHYGRGPDGGEYLVENAHVAKDYWYFKERDDLVAFLVNLPESANRNRLLALYPDWQEMTADQCDACREEDRARLRDAADAKMKAGTAQQFDMDLDGRNGPHAPQRLAGAGLSPDETHWVLGVWYGAKPPSSGEYIRFELGAARLEDRMMIPLVGNAKIPEPGSRARYVMAEISDPVYGLAIVRGSTIDREYAIRRTAQYERGDVTLGSSQAGRAKPQQLQKKGQGQGL